MSATPETQDILHTLARDLTQFAQNVEIINQGNARAVQDLSHSVTQLVETTSTRIAQTQEQLGAVAFALQHPLNAPAPDLTPLLTQLAAQHTHSALKLDPPTYNGLTDFREWKLKFELVYDAKQLSDAHKLTWTLALLHKGASRVATQAAPTTYAELMQVLTRRYTDGNDEFHYRAALVSNTQTGDRFLDLSSRVPTLSDTNARFALVNGHKPEVQVHMLGQHHCTTLAAALEELRVYGHA